MRSLRDFVLTHRPIAIFAGVIVAALIVLGVGSATNLLTEDRKVAETRPAAEVEPDTGDPFALGQPPTKFPRESLATEGIAVEVVTVDQPVAPGARRTASSATSPESGGGGDAGSGSTEPGSVPGAVTAVTAVPGDGRVDLSWSAPTLGGSSVTGYEVRKASSAAMSDATTISGIAGTSLSVSGLSNGSLYYFQVRAGNSVGHGTWGPGEPVAAMPTASEPDAPRDDGTVALDVENLAGQLFALRVEWLPIDDATSYQVECVQQGPLDEGGLPEWALAWLDAATFFGASDLFRVRDSFVATTTGTALLFVDQNVARDDVWFGDDAHVVALDGSAVPGVSYSCSVTPLGSTGDPRPIVGVGGASADQLGVMPDETMPPVSVESCVQTMYDGSPLLGLFLSIEEGGAPEALGCQLASFEEVEEQYSSLPRIEATGIVECLSPTAGTTYGIFDGDSLAWVWGARGDTTYECSVVAFMGTATTQTRITTQYVSAGPPNVPLESSLTASRAMLEFRVSEADSGELPDPLNRGDLVIRCARIVDDVEVQEVWRRAMSPGSYGSLELVGIAGGTWTCSAWMENDRGQGAVVTTATGVVPDSYGPPADVAFLGMDPEQDGNVIVGFEADPEWVALDEALRDVRFECSGKTPAGGDAYFEGWRATLADEGEGRFRMSIPAQYNARFSCLMSFRSNADYGWRSLGTYVRFATPERLPFPSAPTLTHVSWSQGYGVFQATPAEGGDPVLGMEVRCGQEQYWSDLSEEADFWEGRVWVNSFEESSCVARTRSAAGYGQESDPVFVTRPQPGPPGAPTNVVGSWDEAGNLAISWDPPVDDGGEYISHYLVYLYTDSEGTQPVDGWNPKQAWWGPSLWSSELTPSETYYAAVSAVNWVRGESEGPRSELTVLVPRALPAPSLPSAPLSPYGLAFYASGAEHNLFLSWAPPSSTGGGSVTAYHIYTYDDPETSALGPPEVFIPSGGSLSVQLAIPHDDVAYSFRIAAVTNAGEGPLSVVVGPFTFLSSNAPSIELLSLAQGSATLGLVPNEFSGVIEGAYMNCGGQWFWGSQTLDGWRFWLAVALPEGYECVAVARTDVGYSTPSAPFAVVPSAPSEPSDLWAWRPGGGDLVNLRWDPPVADGGLAVSGYLVDVFTDDALTQPVSDMTDLATSSTQIELPGLDPSLAFYLRVRAVNAVGPGAPSEVFFMASNVPPNAPTNLSAGWQGVNVDRSLWLNWNSPDDEGGTPIYGYRIYTYTDPDGLPIDEGKWTGYSFTDPQGESITVPDFDTAYYFRVVAQNTGGEGALSEAIGPYTFLTSAPTLAFHSWWDPAPGAANVHMDAAPDTGAILAAYLSCILVDGTWSTASTLVLPVDEDTIETRIYLPVPGEYSCSGRLETTGGISQWSDPISIVYSGTGG